MDDFLLPNDEQISNKAGVEHQPAIYIYTIYIYIIIFKSKFIQN